MKDLNTDRKTLISELRNSYNNAETPGILLGAAKIDDDVHSDIPLYMPLKMLNRHWLIAGATGTGKTKTVQLLCEQLSLAGVPSLVMDIKGDLSWLAATGDESNTHIQKRHALLGLDYQSSDFAVELMNIWGTDEWVALRTTVTEFGPILFSKILDLSPAQSWVMSMIFKYCDDHQLWLVNLDDVKTVLKYLSSEEGKKKFEADYGMISSATTWALTRKLIWLEQQGADVFFGEPSFEVWDLMSKWVINIVRTMNLQKHPQLFSTFMLSLLAEIYELFPEAWDLDAPRLMIVIDEAHLIFKHANQELIEQLETVVKLIRSKWVGVIFVTQLPDDIPDAILGQLWFKIQHQLRAVTARDRKAIQKAVENYPISDLYAADRLIMDLWIWEAMMTCLDSKWRPTPLVHTYLRAPMSRMDILSESEISTLTAKSLLVQKYKTAIDSESAHEILQAEIKKAAVKADDAKVSKDKKSTFDQIMKSKFASNIMKDMWNSIVRWALGAIGLKIDGRRTFF